ncbi:MAG: DUF1343 domain-containing protein [Bacteroidales bacterium]|nr:DUF1343 domain-containing protein [Bacteroidales bacterium]
MFSFRTTPFFDQPDLVLNHGKLGVLCNQAAWHPDHGLYLYEILAKIGNLKRVFMPEHGLFGELQDQVKLDDTSMYSQIAQDVEFVSLYGNSEESLDASKDKLTDLDALIIELQDVGCRYYTYNTTIFNLFKVLKHNEIDLPIYILDRVNPAGRQVEGTALRAGYRSFIGIEGLVHRHGLTIGEVAYYLYNELNAKFPLHIISYKANECNKELMPWSIPPSPNYPGLFTSAFYSGQCLWEGTNLSEGRGTTRPFEIFGAPFMENLITYNKENGYSGWNDPKNPIYDESTYIRWLKFIPTFHKYKDECCFGFQLLLNPNSTGYHALAHNLRIMRFVHDNCHGFKFREGKYEAGNDKTAIELLLGDKELIDYVAGNGNWDDIKEHIKLEEQKWIRKAKKFLIYEDEQLYRIK